MGGGIKLNDNAFALLLGGCRETLKTIPEFGLRDYGDCRQLNMLELLEGCA